MNKFFLLVLFLIFFIVSGKDNQIPNQKEDVLTSQIKKSGLIQLFQKYEYFSKRNQADSILAVSVKIIIKCSKNFRKDNLSLSEKYYDLAADHFLKFHDYRQMGALYNNKGNSYLNLQFFSNAFKYYKQSEEYYKKGPFPCLATLPTSNLGKIYCILGDYERGRAKFTQSMQIIKQCDGVLRDYKDEVMIRRLNLSTILIDQKKYQQTETEFSKLMATPDLEKDASTHTRLYIYQGLLISKSFLNSTSNLQKIEDQVLKIDVNKIPIYQKNIYHEVLAYIYALKNEKTKSYSNIYLAIQTFELEENYDFLIQNYNAMIFLAKKFGDLDNVVKYQQKLIEVNKNVLYANAIRNVQEFTALYKLNDLEKEKQHLLEQNKLDKAVTELEKLKGKILSFTTIASLFAIFFIGFALYDNRKKSRALAEKNLVIEDNNRKLAKLTNDLERSNHSFQKTFSIISHDLRNPFQTLLGYSSALAENYDELTAEKKLSYVKTIRKAAEENYNLTQSLLEWSLKQYQGFEIKKFPEDIHDVVAQSINSLAGFTEFKNIKIKNEVQNITVKVDKEVVATIINNLLTNAVKFAKKDTEVLVISQQDAASLRVTILNEDDSLTQERSEYIKTYLSATSKEEQDYNIGFGLKIVKEMANLHNAKVEFNSALGKTEVTLVLNNDTAAI